MKKNSRIIVQNIPKHLTESGLKKHFSTFGRITDCRIMFKGNTHRGFAFIGFRDSQSASEAVSKYDKSFIGTQKIKVKFALLKGNKNLKTREKKKEKSSPKEVEVNKEKEQGKLPEDSELLENRFFVKNFPFDVSEDELREVFEKFGELNECRIIRNSEQRSRGFGFVGFVENIDAAKAFDALHNKSNFWNLFN